jgi:hypothetical protein
MGGKGKKKDIQEPSAEDNHQANALAFRELYIPYHVHRQDIDIHVSYGVRKAVNEECGLGRVAGCAGGIPVCGDGVALLFPYLC